MFSAESDFLATLRTFMIHFEQFYLNEIKVFARFLLAKLLTVYFRP